MIKFWERNLKILGTTICLFVCFLLVGCGGSGYENSEVSINIHGFNINYNGNVGLERVPLTTEDLDEIVDLYQEIGDETVYKDSLLIAEKYSQGLGANAFAQDNLDVLKERGLELSTVDKTQISLEKNGENIKAVLVEYEITKGLLSEIPILYISQIFIPNDNDMILMSFITEDKRSRSSASNMFKNIKYN